MSPCTLLLAALLVMLAPPQLPDAGPDTSDVETRKFAPQGEPAAAIRIEQAAAYTGECAVAVTEVWQFKVQRPVVLAGLGVWDLDGDGLLDDHDVAVWDDAGRTVATAKVAAGVETTLIDQFRYAKVEPVLLEAGRTYVIGAHYRTPLKDCHVDGCSAVTFACDGRIEWLQRRRIIADELAMPDAADSFAGTFGPNLLLQAADDDATPPADEHYSWAREGGEWKLVRARVAQPDEE